MSNMIPIKVVYEDSGEETIFIPPSAISGYRTQGDNMVVVTSQGVFVLAKGESIDTLLAQKAMDEKETTKECEEQCVRISNRINYMLYEKIISLTMGEVEARLKKLEDKEKAHD